MISQSSPTSTRTLLLGIWGHLSYRRRIQLGLVLLVMFISGLAELASLGAVVPFLVVLSDPEKLWQNNFIKTFSLGIGYSSPNQLILPAALIFAITCLVSAFVRLANVWLNGKIAAAVGSDLSCEAYRRTLYQDYEVHLKVDSSSIITGATSHISLTVVGLNSLLQVFTSTVVSFGLVVGLLILDANMALSAIIFFGVVYCCFVFVIRNRLPRNGKKIALYTSLQYKALQEGLGAIREVLLESNQEVYLKIYQQSELPLRQFEAKNAFLRISPRYAIEALAMVFVALLAGFLALQSDGASVIPRLGVLALGAQRLLPSLQQVYSGWAGIRGFTPAMQIVLSMLNQPLPKITTKIEALEFRDSLEFKDIHFRYSSNQDEIINGINLQIRRGERIGLIGKTGSGKSTTIDLLMGLLKPTSGSLLIDGLDLHDTDKPQRLIAWRSSIAHVPQSIYLANSTIAENIAFGIPLHEIDISRLKLAAKQAHIDTFIEDSPEGYQTFVGERGIRLSGGQRQRIAIARALYKQAKVLVLDEATSALDSQTEEAIISVVESLSKELTIIMIAHRLTTIQRLDRVLKIVDGMLVPVNKNSWNDS